MEKILFPEGATKKEREINWYKIAEIEDADFGFDTPKEWTDKIRFCVRILLTDEEGKICMVKSEKYGYMQIPGGGIEKNETIKQALRRETEEETGWLISDTRPLGLILERREDVRNTRDWVRYISYVFVAKPERDVGTKYMDDEIAEGFAPMWIKLEDIIAGLEADEGHIESYSGNFSNRRDLLIAKYFQKNQVLR